jgi:diaminopimelate epimerase
MYTQINSSQNEYLMVDETTQMRDQFVNEYCNEKGWDKANLSFEQITEIRSHTQWKNPHLIVS